MNKIERIPITTETQKKLDEICKEKNFLQGESYYQVSNYEQLMLYFVEKVREDE